MTKQSVIFTGIAILAISAGCARTQPMIKPVYHPPPAPIKSVAAKRLVNVRVLLLKSSGSIPVFSLRAVKVYDMRTKKLIMRTRLNDDALVFIKEGRLMLDQRFLTASRIRLVPEAGEYIRVRGKRYRGQIDIACHNQNNGLQIVNYIPLEDYIQGVVPNEVPASWPLEALKAQAIAARTFALYKMSGRQGQPYDLDASTNSQVYRGLDSEKEAANLAVKHTRGLVAVYQGKFIAAFYHSNCGGRTDNIRNVWGSNIKYLTGSLCGFCDNNPHSQWSFEITKAELGARLRRHNIPVQEMENLAIQGRDSSGRILKIGLDHTDGTESLKASMFRMIIGPDRIRSTNFYINDQGRKMEFRGQGWGHGVGLCQEGAWGMARAGYRYDEILKHYYIGVKIRRLKD